MNRDLALWTGILAGPLVWLLSFEANFALAPWACEFHTKLALFVVAILALSLVAASGLLAWRKWNATGKVWPGGAGGTLARERVIAGCGVLMNAMFFLVIAAQTVPNLLMGACD
jgi:uncharacterized membrane protein